MGQKHVKENTKEMKALAMQVSEGRLLEEKYKDWGESD